MGCICGWTGSRSLEDYWKQRYWNLLIYQSVFELHARHWWVSDWKAPEGKMIITNNQYFVWCVVPWQKELLKGCKAAGNAHIHRHGGGGRHALHCTVNQHRSLSPSRRCFQRRIRAHLYLMSFPLLLAGAYVSSILMGHGGGALNRNINYSEEQSCGGHIY